MSNVSIDEKPTQPIADKERNFGGPIWLLFATVGTFFASQIIVAVAAILIGLLLGYESRDIENYLQEATAGQFLTLVAVEILTIVIVWRLVRSRVRQPLKAIGFIKPRLRDLKWLLGGTLLFYGLVILISAFLYKLLPQIDVEQKQELGFSETIAGPELMLAFFALVLLVPLAEEVLMRGYLFTGLRKTMSYLPSALIVSTLFAAAHLQLGNDAPPLWTAAVNTFILSMVLVYLREKTGSLWPAIGLHVINNAIAFYGRFVLF